MSIQTNANNSALTIITPAAALVGTHTFLGWFKQTSGDIQVPFSLDSGAARFYEQFYSNGSQWNFFTDLGAGVDALAGGNPAEFTFLAFVRVPNATTGTIDTYVGNGGALTNTQFSVASTDQGTDITVFAESSTQSFAFNGIGVGVRFWNGAALSADEIAIEYKRIRPITRLDSLYYSLECLDNNSPGVDRSGNGHNATVVSTFTTVRATPPIPYGTPALLQQQ